MGDGSVGLVATGEGATGEGGDTMYAVYMLASGRRGTLYVGVTGRLLVRVDQHRQDAFPGFTSRYGVKRLVWIEWHDSIEAAIHREKRLKKYKREWKINLIENDNPGWEDLYPNFFRETGPLDHLNEIPKPM